MASQASSATLSDEQKTQALQQIQTLTGVPDKQTEWNEEKKQSFAELIENLQSSIAAGKSPGKGQFDELIKLTAGYEEPTTLALKLTERFGYLPSL